MSSERFVMLIVVVVCQMLPVYFEEEEQSYNFQSNHSSNLLASN